MSSSSRAPARASAAATTCSLQRRGRDRPPLPAGAHPWDPMVDYAFMKRNTEDFMSLWRSPKPTIAKVHGHAVGRRQRHRAVLRPAGDGGGCRIGYMPTRVWGCPTTAMWTYRLGPTRAKQLMFTGDTIDGRTAAAWGLANAGGVRRRARRRDDGAGRAHRRRAARPPGHAQDGGQPGAADHGAGAERRGWPPCSTASRATTPKACGSAATRRPKASRPRCSGATAASRSRRATRRAP